MKRIVIILLALTWLLPEADACNICGCGVGNYHYGILPQFQKNFVGLRYRHRSFDSHLSGGHHDAMMSAETFQRVELWGRFYPAKRIQAFVFVPYNMNERTQGDERTILRGLGDMVISANYNIINTYDSMTSPVKHNLLVGGGLKLPTGKFNAIEDGQTINQNFQLGTGSLDFLVNMMYTIRYKKAGLNTELTCSFNTTNKDEYRFGDTYQGGLSAFYILNAGPVTVMPHAGISGEVNKDNRQFDVPFEDTSGWASLYNAGMETYFKNFALGVTYSHPWKQELFNGHVKANDRLALHLTMMF